MTPEEEARTEIDKLLIAAGWEIQDRKDFGRTAALGVAAREFALGQDEADYLLFIDGKAAGVVEAMKTGTTLSGVVEQSEKYMARLPDHLARWRDTLAFDYESTGEETIFRDMRDPHPRSRRVFAFLKPETLHGWLRADGSLRGKLEAMPRHNLTDTPERQPRCPSVHSSVTFFCYISICYIFSILFCIIYTLSHRIIF